MFKVVPDQLRISEGWVRCGQCDEVFDANAHLHSELSVDEIDEPIATDKPGDESFLHASVTTSDEARDADAMMQIVEATDQSELPHHDTFLEKSPQELSRLLGEGLDADDTLNLAPGAQHSENTALAPEQLEPRYLQSEVPLHAVPDEPQLSFMRDAPLPVAKHRPWMRGLLWVTCLLLSCTLVFQVVMRERDRIAAMEPGVKPWLEWACELLACKVSPLHQIESVVIESSSFAKVRADVYRLNFTLKNTAMCQVATPSLELTLTDLQDQSVIRRVLEAGDFGAKQVAMDVGSELAVSLPVMVKLTGSAERVSGYRLLAFYP